MLESSTRDLIFKRGFYKSLAPAIKDELAGIVKTLTQPGKGILSADEVVDYLGRRFDAMKVENTEETRRQFRQLLFTSQDLGKRS